MEVNSNRILASISIVIVTILLFSSFSAIKIDRLKTAMLFKADEISSDSTINQEKEQAQLKEKLDSIQSKLENMKIPKTELRAEIVKKNDLLITKIKQLREGLSTPKVLTPVQLKKAKKDIQQLTYFVRKYCSDIRSLKELEKSKANHPD